MQTQNKPIVGIYCRLSDEDRNKIGGEDSQSIQNQKSLLIDYATKQDWNIYSIYSDDDYSGADKSRPEWNRLLNDCENKKINIVLCKSQSRFSRELEVIEKYLHGKFVEWGTRFVSVVDYADTDVESNKKARQINGLINEWYLEDASKNVRNILKHKAQKGEFLGSFAPYGYIKDPKDKHHLVIDPVAAEIVKRIFNDFTSGIGSVKICQNLNKENVPPPSIYKKLHGLNYYNRIIDFDKRRQAWTPSTITLMVRNETYIGNTVQGKHENISYKIKKKRSVSEDKWIRVENTHEPIIDKATWNTVQELVKSRQRNGKATGTPSPLNRKIFCARCGATMRREHSTYNGVYYKYLTCATRRTTSNCDNASFVRLDEVEQYVIDEINKLLDAYYDEKQIKISKKINNSKATLEKDIKRLNQLVESKKTKIYQLYNDKVDGLISEEMFKDFKNRIENEVFQTQSQIDSLKSSLNLILSSEEWEHEKQTLLDKYRHIENLNDSIVQEFINKITIDKTEDDTISIVIYWNF